MTKRKEGSGHTDPQPSETGLRADQAWYEANRNDLHSRYPDEYVAIVDGELAHHDPEFAALARRVLATYGRRPVLMPRCVRGGRTVHLPSPRVHRS